MLEGPHYCRYRPSKDPLLPRQESRDAELLNIVERIELGEMSRLYFNQIGRILFYLVIVIYLFGDLGLSSEILSFCGDSDVFTLARKSDLGLLKQMKQNFWM